jgi:hypothetical protein
MLREHETLERWAAKASLHATLAREAPRRFDPLLPLTTESLIAGNQLVGEHRAHLPRCGSRRRLDQPRDEGEYPRQPQLASDGVEGDPEGVTFWKLDHGIRWTGMPSWKDTLSDQEMWTVALFLKHMDKLPPAAEQAWENVEN